MRDLYPQHGPRRRWWWPFSVICRCGLDAWPCPAKRMLDRARLDNPHLYADGLAFAEDMQRDRGRWWARGAR
jgi:hypothetical protein